MLVDSARTHSAKPAARAFFVDSENGAKDLLEGVEYLNPSDMVIVFHRGSFPNVLRNQLEMSPARIKWVQCVDAKVKNSMDVQIIADFALRLSDNQFKDGYIVSRDKGFLPAVHYLQETPQGAGHNIALVHSILNASALGLSSALATLRRADSREDIVDFFTAIAGEEGEALADSLECILRAADERTVAADDTAASLSTLGASDGAAAEAPLALGVPEDAGTGTLGGPDGVAVEKPLTAASIPSGEEPSFVTLPGIGKALASKLEHAGIRTPGELRKMGAVNAWGKIFLYDKSFPTRWVYSLDAAIRNVPLNALEPERRRSLKKSVKHLAASLNDTKAAA